MRTTAWILFALGSAAIAGCNQNPGRAVPVPESGPSDPQRRQNRSLIVGATAPT